MRYEESNQKRTQILIVGTIKTPEWVQDEIRRQLTTLGPEHECSVDMQNIEDVDIKTIAEAEPDWLFVYCPTSDHSWVVEKLLVWLGMHPQIHRYIFYEKPTDPDELEERESNPLNPLTDQSYVLGDFCLRYSTPRKLPS